MRKRVANLVAIAIGLATFVVAVHARADLAPPDTCTAPGQPCQNGGDQHNQPGACVATTCTKQVPTAAGRLARAAAAWAAAALVAAALADRRRHRPDHRAAPSHQRAAREGTFPGCS